MLRIHSLGVATLVALMDADRDVDRGGDAARPASACRRDDRDFGPNDAELSGANRRLLLHVGFSDG